MIRLDPSWLAIAALAGAAAPGSACAQDSASDTAQTQDGDDGQQIVVVGERIVLAPLRGIAPEREYLEGEVQSYGSSTVGEFIDEVQAQNGDADPVFLINGELVTGIDDIADYPAEAIERVQVLPRGASQQVGGAPNRRVYNIVVRRQLRTLVLAATRRQATEGGWGETRGEAILTRISGRDRVNLSLRARDSDVLLESDRDILQPVTWRDIALIDPAMVAELGRARSLRPDARSADASLIGAKRLTPWLGATYSLRGRWSRDDALLGLPTVRFDIDGAPYRAYGDMPLTSHSRGENYSANLAFNAARGDWTGNLTAQFTASNRRFEADRPAIAGVGPVIPPPGTDPLAVDVADFLALDRATSRTRTRSGSIRFVAFGPLLNLPAGDLRARVAGEFRGDHQRSRSDFGSTPSERAFSRRAGAGEAGIDIPLTSEDFLGALGNLVLSLDQAVTDVEEAGTLIRSSAALLWQPLENVSFNASFERRSLPPSVEALNDPLEVVENVRVFDFLSGETVDVDYQLGGNPALLPTVTETRRLGGSVSPWQAIALQLTAEYLGETIGNLVGYLPPASRDLLLAFPDRYQRDASGTLIRVDTRPVNFDRQERDELRYGLAFSLPIGRDARPAALVPGNDDAEESFAPIPTGAGARLQFNLSHTIALRDRVTLRDGFAPLNLLDGGAVGFGGGRPRHVVDASVALAERGFGVRLAGQYRSASTLALGEGDGLAFGALTTFNLRAFADLDRIFAPSALTEDTRLTFSLLNLAKDRQAVRASDGTMPLNYHPAYRDPIGQSFEIEVRRRF